MSEFFDMRGVSDEQWAELKRLNMLTNPYWKDTHDYLMDEVDGPEKADQIITGLVKALAERYPAHVGHRLVMDGLSVSCASCECVVEVRTEVVL